MKKELEQYKNLIFIPARKGSSRIKNKNIQKIKNQTLINITVKKALSLNRPNTKIILSTDYKTEELGLDKSDLKKIFIHKRSKNVSGNDASTESTILEFLNQEFCKSDINDGFILLLQVTSPLLKAHSLQKGMDLYDKNSNKNQLTVFSAYKYKPFTWELVNNNFIPISYDPYNRQPTQLMRNNYSETGGFYIFPIKEFFHKKNRFMKFRLPICVNLIESLDIDDMDDLDLAKKIY